MLVADRLELLGRAAGRVIKIARAIGGASTEVDSNFSYDNAGNLGMMADKVSGGGAPRATYVYGYGSAEYRNQRRRFGRL